MTGSIQIYEADIYKVGGESVNPGYNLGTVGFDEYGDLYRFIKVGGSNISKGKLQLAPAPKTNHHNIAAAAAVTANGRERTVTLTLGATASTAQEYAQGLLCATDVAPEGEVYRITNQPATVSAGTQTITVERPFLTSISTSSEFTLVHNPFNGAVEGTSSTRQPLGISPVDITAAYYGWVKSRGIVPALADETLTIGAGLTAGTSTAGAVEEIDQPGDTTVLSDQAIGWAIVAGVDTEYRPIRLCID